MPHEGSLAPDQGVDAAAGRQPVLAGGGEMGALMRSIDWSTTAVGPVETWPQSLRTALSILLETGFPMYIAWGPEFAQFYNDGYRPILGSTKHPAAMGNSTRITFAEIWHIIGPMFQGVMEGTATTVVDFLLPLDRHGFIEECYFIYSYSPIRDEGGRVGGVLVTVTETTSRVLGERRLKTSQALAARTRAAHTMANACALAANVLAENPADLPFSLIYRVPEREERAVLAGASGLARGTPASPEIIEFGTPSAAWPVEAVLRSGQPEVVDLAMPIHGADTPVGPANVTRVVVVPIVQQGKARPTGVLVAGTSPHLMLDEGYRNYLSLLASQIGTAMAGAKALEEAQTRLDALAELDRAKTTFFSNVSHEFRTPLTLMLGPTEEALLSQDRALRADDLETVYRNELRLLKLVNTLLDFSRIEAGRVRAIFEPTDLAALTRDLASAFRSAIERAGLALDIRCSPLPEPVYVDREMWEKIVLNLLSNAFKFTLSGSISIGLVLRGPQVELTVSDTGVGIAQDDLPRIFDRFHRVEGGQARTHEGSGIGLALVRELVNMHHGTIDVSSTPGEGSTFRILLPTGSAHLPAEQLGAPRALAATTTGATPYVEEALRWLPGPAPSAEQNAVAADTSVRILVADDNADMRDYLTRLLGERWSVEAVSDGEQALAAARRHPPTLIVSDVMMPGLDGFALLRALRADDTTRRIPVILLSARAGEEAEIEGLDAGADDYLVKPFTARELVARVQAQLVRSTVRSLEEAHALRLASVFAHAPVGVAILRGPEHVYEFANDQYVGLIGDRPLVGRSVREAMPELEGQGIYELLDSVFRSGEPYVGRSLRLMVRRAGAKEECFFDFVYDPIVDRDQRITGITVVVFEVTELAKARRAAEAANRAKDEFLAMLGHELRNPLAPILTALQLMELRGVKGADRERAIIERQVRHVVSLVDDLLDVSRITRGKVLLKRERVEVADLVAKAIEMTGPAIEERRHHLSVNVPRGLAVTGDPARLAQVVANLLTNAAKYTDMGGRISVSATAQGEDLVLSVKDNGIGISRDMLPRIFDLFAQERQEVDRSQGGLGLGLAIVNSLVQAHGGSVLAASDGKGTGSAFSIRLPLAASESLTLGAEPAILPPAPAPDGCRVLIVDDNTDAAELLGESLTALGHVTRVAFDGLAALEAWESFRPDVALLDIGLPVMDGFELAERVRSDPRFAPARLVAVTGYGQEIDRHRTREAGFDSHLVKPVDLGQLDSWLRSSRKTTTDTPSLS